MNIEIKNDVNQLELYEEFKKYCKYYGENILDNGVRKLDITLLQFKSKLLKFLSKKHQF